MNYKELVNNDLIPEYITVYQVVKSVDDRICPKCVRKAIRENNLDAKKLDNGDYLVNTVSALEYFDYLERRIIKNDRQSRVKYLKDLKAGKTE